MVKREKLTITSIGFEPTKLNIIEQMPYEQPELYSSKGEIVRMAVDDFLIKKGKIKKSK